MKKLAEALLRRKELIQKVEQLKAVKNADLFEFRFERKQVTDNLDDIKAQVPKCDLSQVTEEYDFYAHRLRLIDAAIQQCNWTVDCGVDEKVWQDYKSNK